LNVSLESKYFSSKLGARSPILGPLFFGPNPGGPPSFLKGGPSFFVPKRGGPSWTDGCPPSGPGWDSAEPSSTIPQTRAGIDRRVDSCFTASSVHSTKRKARRLPPPASHNTPPCPRVCGKG